MFIGDLDKEKQMAFVNLAYTMMHADGELAKQEKRLFDSYASEIEVDLGKAHIVEFAEEMRVFDNSTDKERLKVFFELYAIALIDEKFEDSEKVFVDLMQKKWKISNDKMLEMKNGLEQLTNAYHNLNDIVEK